MDLPPVERKLASKLACIEVPMTGDEMSSVAIRLIDVTKTYGSGNVAVTAVKKTTLDIFKNEFFTLLGPSMRC
jgi:hypothetical protein